MLERSAPSFSIASTVESTMPVSAPLHPAWAAPTTRVFGSTSRIGPQSAAVIPIASPSVRVTMASARGRESHSRVGRGNLVGGEQMWRPHAELLRHSPAILHNIDRIVVRANAAVEARVNARRDAAAAVEESVTEAWNGR